jgi:hypothetical protein
LNRRGALGWGESVAGSFSLGNTKPGTAFDPLC